MGGQLCSGENRMPAKERFMFHDGTDDFLSCYPGLVMG